MPGGAGTESPSHLAHAGHNIDSRERPDPGSCRECSSRAAYFNNNDLLNNN